MPKKKRFRRSEFKDQKIQTKKAKAQQPNAGTTTRIMSANKIQKKKKQKN